MATATAQGAPKAELADRRESDGGRHGGQLARRDRHAQNARPVVAHFQWLQAPCLNGQCRQERRQSSACLSWENWTKAATANTVVLLSPVDFIVKAFEGEKVLARHPWLASGQVGAMGPALFHLDDNSSTQLVDLMGKIFS